jgi:hypothetical protein
MTIDSKTENRIAAFLAASLTDSNIAAALDAIDPARSDQTFTEIARSSYEPIWAMESVSMEPYATTHALTQIWQSQAGIEAAERFKAEHGHELVIVNNPSSAGYVALGIMTPKQEPAPLWHRLLAPALN